MQNNTFIDSILLDSLNELEQLTSLVCEKITLSEHLEQNQDEELLSEQALQQIQKVFATARH